MSEEEGKTFIDTSARDNRPAKPANNGGGKKRDGVYIIIIILLLLPFTFKGRFLMSKTVESVINTSLIPQSRCSTKLSYIPI